ncbi:MAG: phosphoesterase RecJ-like protein [Flavobacteriales bacterium]
MCCEALSLHSGMGTLLKDNRKAIVEAAKKIVITAHKSPDGDAVGSSLALYHLLKKMGKDATVILPDPFAVFLKWMPGADEIVFHSKEEERCAELISEADLIFCLDYNVLHRTGKLAPLLEAQVGKKKFILIDHHQQPDTFPDVLISDTSSCSTAELIYEFAVSLDAEDLVDATIGSCIYCGIVTDSGSFRFPNVKPETHEIVASLLRKGVDHAAIHRAIYDTNKEDRMRLVGYALSEKLVVNRELKTAYISLSTEELLRFNYESGDTEGLVNQALSINGVNFAAFLRQANDIVKISFRSQGAFNVNLFARAHFDGGGHNNAAGAATSELLAEAVSRFESLLPTYAADLNY